MKRRTLLRFCGSGTIVALGGCNAGQKESNDPSPILTLSAQVERKGGGWELTVSVRNDHNWYIAFHDVTLVAFTDDGDEVCSSFVGDFPKNGAASRSVTVSCDAFPAILSATATESPCDGAKIEIQYWVGETEQRGAELSNDEIVWDSTYRKCDEALPPRRVLRNVSASG